MGEHANTKGTPDLFGDRPPKPSRDSIVLPEEPAELKTAKVLAAQMRRKGSRREKKQVAHMICLNLIAMLKQGARR